MAKNGSVVVLVPALFKRQKKYFCEQCSGQAEFYTRVPGGEFELLCKKHHQSHGLGFGPGVSYKLSVLEQLMEEEDE